MTSEAVISDMVDRIVSRFDPAQVLLFGSQVRGSANEWSDVDLLVVMTEVTDKRRAAIEIRRSLGDLLVSRDIVVTTPDEISRRGHVVGTVLHAAIREGKSCMNDLETAVGDALRWLRYATEDLDVARVLLTSQASASRPVCWLSQQAAE